MTSWSDGYFADAPYTPGYFDYLSPARQRFCLLLQGLDVPATPDANHCELGYGLGVSINVHAAAQPGRFHGCDFAPAQASFARMIAQDSGNGANLTADSFADFLADDSLPGFDSISLHGIWSWISAENQQTILSLVQRRLRPGGMLYLSYNCQPGWAGLQPFQHLLALHDRHHGDARHAAARIEDALDFTGALWQTAPQYAQDAGPALARHLDNLDEDRRYLAHEYLNRHWHAPYFSDVAERLGGLRLTFGASAQVLKRIDSLYLTEPQRSFLDTIPHPILREQAYDYCINERFRTDIFTLGARQLSPEARRQRLLAQEVVLAVHSQDAHFRIATHLGSFEPTAGRYDPVLQALSAGDVRACRIGDLVRAGSRNGLDEGAVVRAVLTLVGNQSAQVCQPEADRSSVRASALRYNRTACRMALEEETPLPLASPLTGSGLTGLSRIDRLFTAAHLDNAANPALQAWDDFSKTGAHLLRDGTPVLGEVAGQAEISRLHQAFLANIAPLLRRLEILP